MKKTAKRIFVFLLAFSMFFVLCGCDALDEMRDMQAFVEDEHTIIWQGNVYKELPYDEFLDPATTSKYWISVTEPDVPVLLSNILGYSGGVYATEDKQFISYFGETYYCIESIYDDICDRIWKPFVPEIVCYDYSWYNEETADYENDTYILTQEQIDAIKLIVETEKPTELSDGMYLNTRNTIFLEECTADRIFCRSTMKVAVSANGKTYYLTLLVDGGNKLFTVPAGCNAIFDDIYKAYNEAQEITFGDVPVDFEI